MPGPTSDSRSRFPLWLKAVGIIVILLIVAEGGFGLFTRSSAAEWEQYAESLRAGGDPLTLAEIEERRGDFPDEGTLAVAIKDLTEDLEQIGEARWDTDDAVWIFGHGKNRPDFFAEDVHAHIAPSREFLEAHRAKLDAVRTAADLPPGGFSLPLDTDGPVLSMMLPQMSPLRMAAKLLMLEAHLRMVDGDLPAAVKNVEMMSRFSATLNTHPTIIGRLVQVAIDAVIVQTIENLLRVGELDDQALTSLDEIVSARLDAATMRWALLGERAFFAGTCDDLVDGKMTLAELGGGAGPAGLNWLPEILIRKNQIRGVEMLTRLVDGADDPDAMRQATARIEKEAPSTSPGNIIVRMMMPSLTRVVILHLRIESQLKCARVALAAERFRLSTGSLPASLEELVPDFLAAVPIDPFDGQPMRLVTTDEGIVIYSIAENDVDDGGIVTEQKGRHKFLDVGFRLNDPDHRGLVLSDEPSPERE